MTRLSNKPFVFLGLIALCLFLAIPAVAQKETADRYSNVPDGTEPAAPVASGPPTAPNGTLTFFTDRAAFQAAAGPTVLEDFSDNNSPPNNVTVCNTPINSMSNGPCFSPGDIEDGISFDVIMDVGGDGTAVLLTTGFLGMTCDGIGPNFFVDDSEWTLTLPPTGAWGADLTCVINTGTLNIEVFGASGSLGTDSFSCGGPPGNFWGVTSTVDITSIEFIDTTPGQTTAEPEIFCNVEFGVGAVPTMPNWAMIVLLVVLLAIPTVLLQRRQNA